MTLTICASLDALSAVVDVQFPTPLPLPLAVSTSLSLVYLQISTSRLFLIIVTLLVACYSNPSPFSKILNIHALKCTVRGRIAVHTI